MPRTGHCVRKSAALAQLVRALDCGSRGPLFKPGRRYQFSSDNVIGCRGLGDSFWLFVKSNQYRNSDVSLSRVSSALQLVFC